MGLTAANLLVNLVYYGITVALLPWAVLRLEAAAGLPRLEDGRLRLLALAAGTAGALLQLLCIAIFQRAGKGTPSPWLPPRALVLRGPYRLVRNPMNVGELLVLLGLAAWFGSAGLLAYTLLAALAFHAFVVRVEEPRLAARFGADYRRYSDAVPRWVPVPGRPRRSAGGT